MITTTKPFCLTYTAFPPPNDNSMDQPVGLCGHGL